MSEKKCNFVAERNSDNMSCIHNSVENITIDTADLAAQTHHNAYGTLYSYDTPFYAKQREEDTKWFPNEQIESTNVVIFLNFLHGELCEFCYNVCDRKK